MKNSFRILLFIASLFGYTLSAQTPDAEYNLIRHIYKVNADGTTDYTYRKEIKLIRNRAITAYADKGETFIVYNPDFQTISINESYTIRKDGSRVETPKNAFIYQLPSQCENCGRYNHMRELAIVHTALEYDCVIVLEYTIHSQTNILQQQLRLAEDCPIKKFEVIVDLNDTSALYHSIVNNNPHIQTLNDGHALHVAATNLPQTFADAYLPADEKIYPILTFSNRRSVRDLIEQPIESLPQAEKLIEQLRNSDEVAFVEALRNYVMDNLHTVGVDPKQSNYTIATPTEVWQSGCGTIVEKASLMAALLNQAGFTAYPYIGEREYETLGGELFYLCEPSRTRVRVYVDGMERSISMSKKTPLRTVESAIDQDRIIHIDTTIRWIPQRVYGGYANITLPPSRPGGCDIKPTMLASGRKAPVQTHATNETYTYRYRVSHDMEMVEKPIDINYAKSGLGSISISIAREGDDIVVKKRLTLLNDIITAEQYADFRQMMIDWNAYNTIYLKSK